MKKYSEKYIDSYKILKLAKVGIEFEFYSKMSYYKTLEILNNELSPVKVHGFRKYHSSFKPDKDNFKIEPDLSGGSNMVELITGPMDYFSARYYLLKILKLISKYGYTNDKCSLHINISFDSKLTDKDIKNLNILKHIIRTDEDEIYSKFPSRRNNIYAKSVKTLIPFRDYDFSNVGVDIIKQSLKIPNDKYYGINLSNVNNYKGARVEYRYIGGKDYEYKTGDILEFLNKFIIQLYDNIGTNFDNDDIDNISSFLDKKINSFKSFNKYDNFLIEYPTIDLQIDKNGSYDIVNSYYNKIYNRIFNLLESVDLLEDCIINYYTKEQKIEIIGGNFSSIMNIKNFDFINCNIKNGIFTSCIFINSEMKNVHLNKCDVDKCDVIKSKLISSSVEHSDLENCFFMSGYLNSNMNGGIFRSGKLGPYANLSSTTIKISDDNNFFNIKYEDSDDGSYYKKINKFK